MPDISQLAQQLVRWLGASGPDSDIVMSSRVRLARNLTDVPFPGRASEEQQAQILDRVVPIVLSMDEMEGGYYVPLASLDPMGKRLLVERHLISREHAARSKGAGVVVSPDETVSVMLNEEDHVRLQVMESGFNLERAWRHADALDSRLGERLTFGFSTDIGYLTACPTNVGTGMRASVMLHLPAMVLLDQISPTVQGVAKLGLVVRGLFGEGTEAMGNFFQVSNQTTLGESEEDLIVRLSGVIRALVQNERNARQTLLETQPKIFYDLVGRAFGVLTNAYVLSSKEAMNLLSSLRLGQDLGFIETPDPRRVSELFMKIQPAHLQQIAGGDLMTDDRDLLRALQMREELNRAGWKLNIPNPPQTGQN
jgi:protein arginine kinase